MKLKTKPSAKVKRRYLLVEGSRASVERVILDYIGILGWARASPEFLSLGGKLVLSVDRGEIDSVRAAFEASDSRAKIKKVSGTLKGLGVRG
jgi:RNase P/RNase MRP subunit POP5